MAKKNPKSPTNGKLRVAGYIRVSTVRQKVEGDSLEAQKNAIARYLEYRSQVPCESVTFYVEEGKSAKNQNRPELQKLRADIEKGLIDTVVCVKLDRITRSVLDFADLWQFFVKHGVEFISLTENVDSSTTMGEAMMERHQSVPGMGPDRPAATCSARELSTRVSRRSRIGAAMSPSPVNGLSRRGKGLPCS